MLVVGLNWIGDAIMSFPALYMAFQEIETLDVLTRPHLSDIYALHPAVKKVWSIPTGKPFFFNLAQFSRIRRKIYDRVIVFPRSFRSAFTAFICGGVERIGFSGEGRDPFLTRSVPLPEAFESRHESKLYEHLMEAAGFSASPKIGTIRGSVLLSWRFGFPLQRPFAVIAPGAAFGEAKRWPVEHFRELAGLIVRGKNLAVVATGSASEAPLTARVVSDLGEMGLDLGGRTSLRELMSVLAQARFVVANDSGTMHLAAVLGKPVVVPVGSTDMKRTGPLTEKAFPVTGKICSPPCRKRICRLENHRCMESIPAERLWREIQRMPDWEDS